MMQMEIYYYYVWTSIRLGSKVSGLGKEQGSQGERILMECTGVKEKEECGMQKRGRGMEECVRWDRRKNK